MNDEQFERALLGAIILYPAQYLKPVLTEGLRPEHFHTPHNALVFQTIVEISDTGVVPDPALIGAKTGNPLEVDHLTAEAPVAENVLHYAEQVRENHRWRQVKNAGYLLVSAAESKDKKLEQQADELLTAPAEGSSTTYTPEMLQDRIWDRLNGDPTPTIPLPYLGLTGLCGGLRRGEMVLLGGHTSFGKSVVLDSILTKGAEEGFKAHCYLNEMSADQRVDRFLAAKSGVPFGRIRGGRLNPEEAGKVLDASEQIPWGMTDAAGWSAEEIARHIRFHDWDLVGVDILHLIDHTEEKDLNNISRTLNQVAKIANCALVATVHLNRGAAMGGMRRRPTVTDIKGSSSFEQQADLVLFVHREQDSNGEPTHDGHGELYIAKGRNTRLGGIEVWLNPNTMTFGENPWL